MATQQITERQAKDDDFINPDEANEHLKTGFVDNIDFSATAGTFSFHQADGSAFDSTDAGKGKVWVRNSTGAMQKYELTSNPSFSYGATSDIDSNRLGLSDVTTSADLPIFIGVINDDTNAYFCISRKPLKTSSSSASNIGQKGSTGLNSDSDILIITTGLTLANWTSKPITQVGWVDASYSSVTKSFSFSDGDFNGFNDNYKSKWFGGNSGAFGADRDFLKNNGGTAPEVSTEIYEYKITDDGFQEIQINLSNDGGTDGSGSVLTQVVTALTLGSSSVSDNIVGTGLVNNATYTNDTVLGFSGGSGTNHFYLWRVVSKAVVFNGDFTNGGRQIKGWFRLPIDL